MPLVYLLEALFLEHAQPFLKREGDAHRRGERRHAFVGPRLRFLPVEIEPRRASLRLLSPGAIAHTDQRQSRRRHPSLLRAADGDIDPQASVSIGIELMELTPSTTTMRPASRATRASSRSGLVSPVDVSLCVSSTTPAFGWRSTTLARSSGSTGWPHSNSSLTTSAP